MTVFVLYKYDYENSGIVAVYATRDLAETEMQRRIDKKAKYIEQEKAANRCGYGELPCLDVLDFDVLES